MLVLLQETPTLTGSKLAEDLDIGRGTVKEYLRRLKAKGVLVREGSTRTGRWRLNFSKVELQQVARATPPNHPRNHPPNHPSNLRRRPYPGD